MELFIAIALLCGNPSNHDGPAIHSTKNVQSCQKYYVRCMDGYIGHKLEKSQLTHCLLQKKKFGGDK